MAFFESGHGALFSCTVQQHTYHDGDFSYTGKLFVIAILQRERQAGSSVDCVCEDSSGYSGKYWSMEVKPISERSFTGNWEDTSVTQFPDLTISEPVQTQLQWGWEGHQVMYYLPDGITVSCPREIIEGTAVDLVANWLVTDTKNVQITVKYDENGFIRH